jgi:RIO kinase 1
MVVVVPGQFEDAECSDDDDDENENNGRNGTEIGPAAVPFGDSGMIQDQPPHDPDECLPNHNTNNDDDDDDDDEYVWYQKSGDTKLSKSFPKKKTTTFSRTVPLSSSSSSSPSKATTISQSFASATKPQSSSSSSSSSSSLLPSSQQQKQLHHHHYNNDEDDYDDHFDDDDNSDDDFKTTFRTSATAAAAMSNISHKVQNRVQQLQHLEYSKRTLHTDKNDRATSEQVLDPRTRYILFKLLQSNQLREFHGCISTGKEANVYYATAGVTATVDNPSMGTTTRPPPPTRESQNENGTNGNRNITEYAVKIYKTSILVFKDRDKYVSGEYRYRNGYCKSNPRKMISIWAEKEIRNYKRIYFNSTIPCPQPILIKQHVLVMEFLGHDGWPSPRLKDVVFSDERRNTKYYAIYRQCLHILRQLVQQCKLIHGDYSEYNLLYHHEKIYVIDVSQSVELNHPMAMDLLKQDITNITDYFKKLFYKTNCTTGSTIAPGAGQDSSNDVRLPTAGAAVAAKVSDATDFVDDFYLLSPMEAFDYIMAECHNSNTTTNSNDVDVKSSNQKKIDDHDKELLHKLLEEGQQRRREQRQKHEEEPTDQQQQQARYEMMMKERIFLNSYIPRTLNEITVTEKDYYATLNQSSSSGNNKSSNAKTTSNHNGSSSNNSNATSIEAQAIAAMTIHNHTTSTFATDVTTSRAGVVPLSPGDIQDPSTRGDDPNSTSDKDSDDDDDDDSSSTCSSNDVQYVRVHRTVEEIEQDRLIRKEERRSNKKLVKGQQSLKRQNKKMKKKDKKRAITKTKSKT